MLRGLLGVSAVLLAAGLAGAGDELPVFTEAFGGNQDDHANAVAGTADGGLVVVGCSYETASSEFLVAKFDANGDLDWRQRAAGYGYGVVVTAQGDIYAVGSTTRPAAGGDIVVWKLSSAGVTQWVRRWSHDGYDDRLSDVIQATDGTIWAAGTMARLDNDNESRIFVVRIDADGSAVHGAYAGHANWYLSAAALVEVFGNDGPETPGFCVTGTAETGVIVREKDVLLAKFSPEPEFLLERHIQNDDLSHAFDESGTDLWRTTDRGIVITGYSTVAGMSAFLVNLDRDLELDWAKIAAGPLRSLNGVIENSSGNLVTVGQCNDVEDRSIYLSSWTLAGQPVWNRAFATPAYGAAVSLAEEAGGMLVTAGTAYVGAGGDDVCLARHNSWGHTCLDPEVPGPTFADWSPYVLWPTLGDVGVFTGTLEVYHWSPYSYPMVVTEICRPETLRVCPDGSGDYATIQPALDHASHCDVVELCDGIYTGVGNWDLRFGGKSINLRSASGHPQVCVLDGDAGHRGLVFDDGEDPTAGVAGISIVNSGLEAMLFDESAPVVTNCRIIQCGSPSVPAVVSSGEFAATLRDCRIEDSGGVGIACDQTSLTLDGCTIAYNYGTGLTCTGAKATLTNCTVAYNGDHGLEVWSSDPILDRSIIAFNHGWAVYCYQTEPPTSHPLLTCCDVWGNTSADWEGCIAGQEFENDNLAADPLFCATQNPADPLSISTCSPCAAENNPACGLVGARPTGCVVAGEGGAFLGTFVADAYLERTIGSPPYHSYEHTLSVRDGAIRPLSYFPPGRHVAFLMDMVGIDYGTRDGDRPVLYYFGEVALYDPRNGDLVHSIKVPGSWRNNLGLAIQPVGPFAEAVFWTTREDSAKFYTMDEDGAFLGSYPAFSTLITGLAMDTHHSHLWCVARGEPDLFAEYDVASGEPILIQGPFPVPWPPSPAVSEAAGLAYDDADDVGLLVGIDAGTNRKVTFRDRESGYGGPPGAGEPQVALDSVCALDQTTGAWGVAVIQSEQQAYVGGDPGNRPRPIDRYVNCPCPTAVDDEVPALAAADRLEQNEPNPFNPSTVIRYWLARRGPVRLEIFDLRGRKMATLVDGVQSAGAYEVTWFAPDEPSGIYCYRLVTGNGVLTRKSVLLK